MLPVVRGDRETARQIVLYSFVMVAFTVFVGLWLGPLYTAAALVLGAVFIALSLLLRRDLSRARARCSSTTRSSTSRCSSRPRRSTRCSSDGSRARTAQPPVRLGAGAPLLPDLRRHDPRRGSVPAAGLSLAHSTCETLACKADPIAASLGPLRANAGSNRLAAEPRRARSRRRQVGPTMIQMRPSHSDRPADLPRQPRLAPLVSAP